MTREILFRGKRKDNGEWVEGYYTCMNGNHHRIYTGYAETDCGNYYPDWDEVIPETVGRYTGLTDMSGRRIFEGDIIKDFDLDNKYIVEYDNKMMCFLFRNVTNEDDEDLGPDEICGDDMLDLWDLSEDEFQVNVMGNIHDNNKINGEIDNVNTGNYQKE